MKFNLFAEFKSWLWRPEWPEVTALWRIGFGLTAIAFELQKLPHLLEVLTPQGFHYLPAQGLNFFSQPLPVPAAIALFSLTIFALLAFTLGVYPRLAALLSLAGMLWIFQVDYYLSYHVFDYVFHLGLFLAILSPGLDQAFALKFSPASETFAKLPTPQPIAKMFALLITLIYVGSALQKIQIGHYLDWRLIYYTWIGMYQTDVSLWLAAMTPKVIMTVLTRLSLVMELIVPFFLWYAPWRRLGLFLLLAFHLVITASLTMIAYFSFLFITAFILFVPSKSVHRWLLAWRQPKFSALTIYFDTGCRLCHRTKNWVQLHSPELKWQDLWAAKNLNLTDAEKNRGIVIDWAGEQYQGYLAVLVILLHFPSKFWRTFALLGQIPIIYELGQVIYWFLARTRRFIFGTCTANNCDWAQNYNP